MDTLDWTQVKTTLREKVGDKPSERFTQLSQSVRQTRKADCKLFPLRPLTLTPPLFKWGHCICGRGANTKCSEVELGSNFNATLWDPCHPANPGVGQSNIGCGVWGVVDYLRKQASFQMAIIATNVRNDCCLDKCFTYIFAIFWLLISPQAPLIITYIRLSFGGSPL